MLKKYNINDLVNQVNLKIKDLPELKEVSDSRVSDFISERKVRDLLSKNLISRGIKDGKSIYFDDLHVDQIIEYKKLQAKGLSEKIMKSYVNSGIDENDFNKGAMQEIDNILNVMNSSTRSLSINGQGNQLFKAQSSAQQTQGLLQSNTLIDSLLDSTKEYRTSIKSGIKSYTEYSLDESGSITLKLENGYKVKNASEILEKIKQIIGE